ncbi:hypothetical protein [Streptomyces sp. NPDC004728]
MERSPTLALGAFAVPTSQVADVGVKVPNLVLAQPHHTAPGWSVGT